MRRSKALFSGLIPVLLAAGVVAQVVSPSEIKDPASRDLQVQYIQDLQNVGHDILANHFDYPFYLGRKLGLDEAEQKRGDQRSIRFDQYNGLTVLAITGNYYAAYSLDKTSVEQRARTTFLNVVMPILKASVPHFQNVPQIQGYAIEVSHHVLGSVMNVAMERYENLMVFLPQKSAIRLLGANDDNAKQAALLEGQAFLNAQPVTLWLSSDGPPPGFKLHAADAAEGSSEHAAPTVDAASKSNSEPSVPPAPAPEKPQAPAPPPRDTSPQALAGLQAVNQDVIAALTKELDAQAHFVHYATPNFVVFRQGIYLELSVSTNLPASAAGSRYKLAALAFDDHIAHLARPTLAYFKNESAFDGISFSTSVRLAGKAATGDSGEAVEFFFPFTALRCYERYDCTGQQLIDAGTVLINGERVSLDLQSAEASPAH